MPLFHQKPIRIRQPQLEEVQSSLMTAAGRKRLWQRNRGSKEKKLFDWL